MFIELTYRNWAKEGKGLVYYEDVNIALRELQEHKRISIVRETLNKLWS
jgi:hypothetical protein